MAMQLLEEAKPYVDGLVAETRFVRRIRDRPARSGSYCGFRLPGLSWEPGTAPGVAINKARQGLRVAIVNPASAYQVGGGFCSGGRHALEEALCAQSTLLFSLQEAERQAGAKGLRGVWGTGPYIPEDGVVLSPGVVMLRHGTESNYVRLHDPLQLAAVVSLAMPNRNRLVTDSPMDPRRGREFQELLENKFSALIEAVRMSRANVLIMPDVGCGVFQNKPQEVGKVLGRVLREQHCSVQEVICVGSTGFYRAVRESIEGRDGDGGGSRSFGGGNRRGRSCKGHRRYVNDDDSLACFMPWSFSAFFSACFGRSRSFL